MLVSCTTLLDGDGPARKCALLRSLDVGINIIVENIINGHDLFKDKSVFDELSENAVTYQTFNSDAEKEVDESTCEGLETSEIGLRMIDHGDGPSCRKKVSIAFLVNVGYWLTDWNENRRAPNAVLKTAKFPASLQLSRRWNCKQRLKGRNL